MLIWMRDSAFAGVFKFFLLGMLLLAVGGLVFMDVGGYFTGNMTSGTIAKGGGVNIGATEFNRTVERNISRQGITARDAYKFGLVQNILTSEIQNRLFTKEARSIGLEVGDDAVMAEVSKMADKLATQGGSKKQALQNILRTQGISESEFIGGLRQEMANNLLRMALTAPTTLSSPLMAGSLYRYDNEVRAANVIVFKNSDIKDAKQPTSEQLATFYESNKMDFLIPETRTITMATLKTDMLQKNITITDDQVKAEYEKNVASFTKPSRRVVEQIVLKSEDEAKKTLADMTAGKSPKNAITQEYEQAGLIPDIATPVFSAKNGAILGPIKTDLGWHVLKVKETIPESVMPLDDKLKASLKTELASIALTDELFRAGNTIEDRVAAGDPLEDLVKEYGMTTQKIGPFRENGKDANGVDLFKDYARDREKIVLSSYDYEQGEIPPVVETADGQFHLIRIDAVTPDTYRPLAAVKADLEKRWIAEQQELGAMAFLKSAQEQLAAGKTLADIAKEKGVAVQSISGINRKSAPPAPLTPVVTAQVFNNEIGQPFSAQLKDGVIIGAVTSVTIPPSSAKPDAAEMTALNDLTGTSLSQDILGQFVAALTGNHKIKINQAALEQMYGAQQEQQQ